MKRLHHRSNTNQYPPSPLSSLDGPLLPRDKSLDEKRPRPLRRYQPRTSRLRTRILKATLGLCLSISLLVYALALFYKDWPPDVARLTADGQIDQLQGEWWVSRNLTRAERFMLVVAHPDDECLFFSPTLLNLLSPRYVNRTELNATLATNVSINDTLPTSSPVLLPSHSDNSSLMEAPIGHVLSLSSGNAEGLGLARAREMRASCWSFGIPSTKCIVLDHPELPDSMSVWWPEQKIAEFVKIYVDLWKIDMIITFDHYGVSGHANHRAIAAAMSRLVHTDPKFPATFMLRSTSLVQKYTSLLSLPWSLYRHAQTRKSLLPPLSRPPAHPSRDKRRLAALVQRTLVRLNVSVDASLPVNASLPIGTVRGPSGALGTLASGAANVSTAVPRLTDAKRSSHPSLFLSTPRQYYEGRRAFNQHVSQTVWFRRLWLVFSQYMWINELERVVPIGDRFVDDEEVDQVTGDPVGSAAVTQAANEGGQAADGPAQEGTHDASAKTDSR